MPSRVSSNDANHARSTFKRVHDPRSSRAAHRVGQFIRAEIAKFRDLLSRTPRMLSRNPSSYRKNDVIFERLRIDAEKLAGLNIEIHFFPDFASQCVEWRLAAFNATARCRPPLRRVIRADAENAPTFVKYCCEYADGWHNGS